jgi:hypothetical protein
MMIFSGTVVITTLMVVMMGMMMPEDIDKSF